MFLLPACLAGTADALILYLDNEWESLAAAAAAATTASAGTVGVFYPRYVPILAWIRLGLLGAPLSYHTYTGTRLHCPLLYQLFYVTSLVSLAVHMVSILMLDPDSVRTVLLFLLFRQDTTQTSASSPPEEKGEEEHELAVDRLWILLWLSVVATALHFALLFHVRSSAPYRNLSRPQKKSRLLAYYASRHWNLRFASFLTQQKEDQRKNRSHNYTAIPNVNDNVNNSDDVYRRGSDAGSNALWMSQHEDDSDHENNLEPMPTGPSQQANHANIMMCLPDGYDDFMSEFQMGLATTKQKWVERLDEFTHRFHLPHHHAAAAASNNPHGGDHSTGEEQQRLTPLFHPLQAHMTPFRVLLQLFAYEEVLTNGKLDRVFDADNEAALTFYVPQLLSFLLHGAFFNSPQLEEWILAKCKSNVHFAHCCFWFLRAWCSAHHPNHHHLTNNSIDSFDDDGGADSHDQLRRHGSENDLKVAALPFPYDTITSTSPPLHESPGRGPRRVSSFHDRISMSAETETEESHKKYAPEERTLIEGLLLRVMECGEEAAQKLQYGATGQPDDITLVGLKNEASETRFIPVNPHTGYPSVAHLNAVTAKKKIGFMSLDHVDNDKNDDSTSTINHHPPLHPTGRRSPIPMALKSFQQVNNLNKNNSPYGRESIFQQTPKFLSTLLSLADDLFLLPRPQRTTELRRRLRALEIQYLPSNAIYMPIKDTHHRVWRIVVDESLAISTKERVPCIICLEVIDYNYSSTTASSSNTAAAAHTPSKPPSGRSTSSENMSSKTANGSSSSTRTTPLKFLLSKQKKKPVSEHELVSRWTSQPRDPHRHDTIKDKVISITQEGFRKGLQSLRKHQHKQDALFWKDGDQDENQELECLDLEVGNATGTFQNLSESFLENEESNMSFPSTPSVQNTLDADPLVTLSASASFPPPLGGSLTSPPLSACSSPSSSRPQSPTTAMGQWSSPKLNRREAIKLSSEEPIPMIPDLEPDADTAVDALSQIGQTMDSHHHHYNGSINSKTPERSPSKLPRTKSSTKNKPSEARRPKIIFKESWEAKERRIRAKSAYGSHPGWRLLPILIKSNDDLRQEQLASQLISRMASILARARVPTWLFPYEILALNDRGGIIEAIPDTISIDSLKRNDPDYTDLSAFFISHFGQGGSDEHSDAMACFVESLAAYSMVCFLLQIKDRHNGNIMLDQKGHVINIDFGFFFLSSPGKNSGFESAPFKLTREFVDLMDGPDSRHFAKFRELCCKTFLELRKHCYQIILLVEMLMVGNEDLNCFRGRPEEAVQGLRDRFRLDLNDRACIEYVNSLIDESLENWRTRWYDRYQRICVGVL